MIVKNEEANLERCLKSLAGRVDEVVLVDTGSTDRTVEIAQAHGARVFHFTWCDDFAAARNESLRHATGDWIIWVDGDDELVERRPGALRSLCAQSPPENLEARPKTTPRRPGRGKQAPIPHGSAVQTGVPAAASGFSAALLGYWVACDSVGDEDGTGGAVAHQWRLFRNRRGIRFRGRIHEEPIPPDTSRPLNVLRQDAVLVRHWGYVPNPEVIARKRERNERLLQRAIAEDPDNAYNYFSFGEQKVWEEDFDQAGAYLQKARELWRKSGSLETPFVGPMFSMSAYAAMQLNHHQECLDIEREAPPEFFSSDLLCCTGMACWRLGRRDEAIARLERAATDPGLKGVGFLTDPSTSTWKPRLFLARFHLELGLKDQAYEWARQAMEHLPARPEIALGWAALLAQRGDREEATRWLLQVLDQPGENEHKPRARKLLLELAQAGNDDTAILRACEGAIQGLAEPERALTQAAAYGRLGRLQDQYDVLDRACREYPAAAAIRLALADILEAAGYADQALPVVAAGIDLPDPPVSLYLRLAGLLAKLGRAEDAANARTLATLVASRQ